jgi:hypothetical protein
VAERNSQGKAGGTTGQGLASTRPGGPDRQGSAADRGDSHATHQQLRDPTRRHEARPLDHHQIHYLRLVLRPWNLIPTEIRVDLIVGQDPRRPQRHETQPFGYPTTVIAKLALALACFSRRDRDVGTLHPLHETGCRDAVSTNGVVRGEWRGRVGRTLGTLSEWNRYRREGYTGERRLGQGRAGLTGRGLQIAEQPVHRVVQHVRARPDNALEALLPVQHRRESQVDFNNCNPILQLSFAHTGSIG